ncbi:citrate/2-methylcitrate synthase, partial [Bittarella massiliensis (ex Durand et al. 2017)]
PTIITNTYQVKRRNYDHKSMYFHLPKREHSTAQTMLRTVRPDKRFTEEEAHLLDLCLILHAEHGGGNNSACACRVLSSSLTDTYSALASAVGSLKGPRHGGANLKVT